VGLLGIVVPAFAAGFSVAASPGAVNLLGLRWGLQRGAGATLLIGLGAATADASYVAMALVGLLPLLAAAGWLSTALLLVGGLVLVLLGLRSMRSGAGPSEQDDGKPVRGMSSGRGPFLLGLTVTVANPLTIAAWLAIAGGLLASVELGDGALRHGLGGALVLAAVFAGSAAWFAVLALLVAALRTRMGATQLRFLAIATGLVLVALGLVLVVRGGIEAFA
jgi:threonine/homoserine/homoserine lactone efflux protein